MTETLFAIGAGELVAGVTDYDDYPERVRALPRTGTILTPNYEAISGLSPTLIVGEAIAHAPHDRLAVIAPTKLLPWLTLEDVAASTRELGRLAGRVTEAEKLAVKIENELAAVPAADAPRLLVVMAGAPGRLAEIWFIKRNSLHGAALHAAGARNAVARDVPGAPTLSPEQVTQLDPDGVILLIADTALTDAARDAHLTEWRALPLRAMRQGKIAVLHGPDLYVNGPRILNTIARLRLALADMGLR